MRPCIFIFCLLGGSLLFSATAQAQDPKAVITPAPLEVWGDSVVFKANITVPRDRKMRKDGSYVIRPELGGKKMTPISIPSSRLNDPGRNGINTSVRVATKFEEDMIGNDLEIEHEYQYGKKKKEFKDMDDIADCCVTTGRLFIMNSQYEMQVFQMRQGATEPLKMVAQLNFPLDVSKFSTYNPQQELKAIGEYLKKNPNATITIRGYASPEGTFERNKTLANERAEAAKQWLVTKLNKGGYAKNFDAGKIKVETTTEDWRGYLQTLQRSQLSEAQQRQVADIISAGLSPAETEKRVMAITGGRKQTEEYLAPLRRATVVIEAPGAFRPRFTTAQIDSVATLYTEGKIPESSLKDIYGQEEYLQAAQRTYAKEGKVSLFTAYYQKYPDDIRAFSNVGVATMVDDSKLDIIGGDDALIGVGFNRDEVDIDTEYDLDDDKVKVKYKYKEEDTKHGADYKVKIKRDLDEAEQLLVQAYEKQKDSEVIANNLAGLFLMKGNYTQAKPFIEQLERENKGKTGQAANYNMGLYYARTGDIHRALQHFEQASKVKGVEYNRGLAKLMTGNPVGAKADLQAYLRDHPDHALANYVMAIAGARTNDLNTLTTHLKKAIAANENLSDVAKEDLEFKKYWSNDAFKKASDDDPKK
ncbi:MAG: OmpA family protein [Hymenobacteraceae bacterium]|nr:OmpA family protein [Hymenobacteraceae bacterium]